MPLGVAIQSTGADGLPVNLAMGRSFLTLIIVERRIVLLGHYPVYAGITGC
jgi:hypothetical protein